ncbi:MAG TPA: hypothetical protein VNZ53_04140 [Steroidobacteraceae bacterium]|jgi:hypothetical protein|nr:hypothetical protein [Steroidobacteraceae bacterium]
MPRRSRTHLFPVALSKAELAVALRVPHTVVEQCIADGLPVYSPPVGVRRHRILVSDIVEHIRKHWRKK